MNIKYFFHDDTSTFTYIVSDASTKKCAVIDPVLDYNIHSGRTKTIFADKIIEYINDNNLTVEWLLENHAHADHITAANYLKNKIGGKTGIGENIKEVIKFWVPVFSTESDTPLNGSQFDHLFKDQEIINIGNLEVKIIYTPGHTPACVSYLIQDSIFVGDTIFMPHMGTARTDFPGGSSKTLYQSIQKIYQLPNETKIYVGHDYPPQGQQPEAVSTVLEQKQKNNMINQEVSESEYVSLRNSKNKGKPVPNLLLPSIQVNIRCGDFGKKENNTNYVKIPINKI